MTATPPSDKPSDPGDPHRPRLGELLRERRMQAGLSRPALAARAGVSESTLKNIESGRHQATALTLRQLCAVAELRLSLPDLLATYPPAGPRGGPPLNCWLAPGFEPLTMLKELIQQINGRGGHIEQSYLYLDHMSAACWCAIADQDDYAQAQRGMPIDRAAAQVRSSVGDAGLDVLGLGCGDAKNEVRLVQYLTEQPGHGDLRLYLLDISQPMLSVAYKHAAEILSGKRVSISAVQGNFHHLPRYTQLLYQQERGHRRRLICMFGGTFGNLENEVLFVRDSLVGFAAGDLLLINTSLAAAPADRTDEILRRDPRLAGRLPPEWQRRFDEWLAGPIRRYGRDVTQVEFHPVLDQTSCPVPGSYAVELRAVVKSAREPDREFSIFRVKRHDPQQLVDCLKQLGWDPVDGWRYGEDPVLGATRLLYLFRRRGD